MEHEIKVTELNEILNQVHRAVLEISSRTSRPDDIIVSIPDYFIDVVGYQHQHVSGVYFNKESMRLFGCKVQFSYENKITVFNKHRFYTKENYIQIELNNVL